MAVVEYFVATVEPMNASNNYLSAEIQCAGEEVSTATNDDLVDLVRVATAGDREIRVGAGFEEAESESVSPRHSNEQERCDVETEHALSVKPKPVSEQLLPCL